MQMEEKIYKSMGRSGALSIAVGVVAICNRCGKRECFY